MKIMGLDFGKARIGIALSDIMGFLASPYSTLNRTTEIEDLKFLDNIIKQYKINYQRRNEIWRKFGKK